MADFGESITWSTAWTEMAEGMKYNPNSCTRRQPRMSADSSLGSITYNIDVWGVRCEVWVVGCGVWGVGWTSG